MKKILITFIALGMGVLGGHAQSRSLTILETNPDVRTAALGNVMLGNTDRMHLYVNPAAVVFGDSKLSIDFATEIYPSSDAGRMAQYNLGAGYKFLERHAAFAGFRYLGGLKVPMTLDGTIGDSKPLKPFEWAADFGYAFGITPEFVAYASGSYAMTYSGVSASGMTFSVGLGYQKDLNIASAPSLLTLGVRLLDAGPALKYEGSELTYPTPMSIALGGDLAMTFAQKHDLTVALGGRYFTPSGATMLKVGTGVEYTYDKMISARIGYEYGQKETSHLTMGLGGSYSNFHLDLTYGLGLAKPTGVNTFMIGFGFDI